MLEDGLESESVLLVLALVVVLLVLVLVPVLDDVESLAEEDEIDPPPDVNVELSHELDVDPVPANIPTLGLVVI